MGTIHNYVNKEQRFSARRTNIKYRGDKNLGNKINEHI
jgi:hypothetical protein